MTDKVDSAIYIHDVEFDKIKTIKLKTFLTRVNHTLRNENQIYFALHFAIIFLGLIIAIHVETWIGLAIMGLFTVKFLLMFPDLNERTDI